MSQDIYMDIKFRLGGDAEAVIDDYKRLDALLDELDTLVPLKEYEDKDG